MTILQKSLFSYLPPALSSANLALSFSALACAGVLLSTSALTLPLASSTCLRRAASASAVAGCAGGRVGCGGVGWVGCGGAPAYAIDSSKMQKYWYDPIPIEYSGTFKTVGGQALLTFEPVSNDGSSLVVEKP